MKLKVSKPYFSHDISAKLDEKIIRMMYDFRKNESEIIAHAVYGIYWEIIEYLHENSLGVDELDMLADTLRVDRVILERILNNYDLFKVVDGKYISERVLRNLKMQEEKSEKARQSVNRRYRQVKNQEEVTKDAEEFEIQEHSEEYSEDVVNSIIDIFNDRFKKEVIVSEENKQRIFDIHVKNKLSMDVWEKIFSNAKRGWDIGDKKNVEPNFKKILDEWDSFASDDYFLAPDREAIQREKELQELKKEEAKQESAKGKEEFERSRNAVCDKKTAIEHINRYFSHSENFLKKSPLVKKYMKEYGFTVEEIIKARDGTK